MNKEKRPKLVVLKAGKMFTDCEQVGINLSVEDDISTLEAFGLYLRGEEFGFIAFEFPGSIGKYEKAGTYHLYGKDRQTFVCWGYASYNLIGDTYMISMQPAFLDNIIKMQEALHEFLMSTLQYDVDAENMVSLERMKNFIRDNSSAKPQTLLLQIY